jgi:hypothetical protein
MKFKCERAAAAVPRDCQHMGFAMADFAALAAEGAYQLSERTMSAAFKDMARSVLMAVGAVMVYMGVMDAGMVEGFVGAALTIGSVFWSMTASE